jgi:predicted PurR-regulated permease PerM
MSERSTIADTIRQIGVVSWSLLGSLLLIAAFVWGIGQISNLIVPIVVAIVVIYMLNPVVNWLQKLGMSRLLGSCLSYLALIGLIVAMGFLAYPSISDQARTLGDDFPQIYDDLATDAERWADDIGFEVEVPDYDELQEDFDTATEAGGFLSFDRISDLTLTVLEFILLLILAPVIAFYVLMDLPKLRDQSVELIPPERREEVLYVSRDLGRAVGGYLRGQLLVALIVGILTSFGFWLIGLDFWLLIGMIAGFLNIVPFVGPWVGGALGVLVALATADPTTAVWAAAVAALVQQVDNHFISPNVLRYTVRLHPATIILALLVGGTVAGLLGVLLAVPVVAIIKIIVGHLWRTRVLHQSWEEASDALIEEHPTVETPVVGAASEQGPPGEDTGEGDEL